jgi:hypothetical protein
MYQDADTTVYRSKIQKFVKCCDEHHLLVNVKKMEEMAFDLKSVGDHVLVVVRNANIAQVSSYKYLGVHTCMDNIFSWKVQVESVCSRVLQHLYFLHRVEQKKMPQTMQLQTILRYGITVWFGNFKSNFICHVPNTTGVVSNEQYQQNSNTRVIK